MLTISLLARKGGTGKTTMSLSLAGAFVAGGARVLCLDLDGQGSLSRVCFGPSVVEALHPSATAAGLFDPRYDPAPDDVIRPTRFDRLAVVPSSDTLESFNRPHPAEAGEAQHVVRRFLAEVRDRFDLVVIDTGPNTSGLLGWAALAASDYVVSPILADPFGAQAVIHVQRLVEEVREKVNPKLRIAGYLVNQRKKEAIQEGYEQTLRSIHGPMIFAAVIPLMAAYKEAAAARGPVTLLKPKLKASALVQAVADELTDRMADTLKRKDAA
ncbi:MAG: soj 4 [Gemmataceae bacterium]|nr:soj 4 [Gemmataceae bacterium]